MGELLAAWCLVGCSHVVEVGCGHGGTRMEEKASCGGYARVLSQPTETWRAWRREGAAAGWVWLWMWAALGSLPERPKEEEKPGVEGCWYSGEQEVTRQPRGGCAAGLRGCVWLRQGEISG